VRGEDASASSSAKQGEDAPAAEQQVKKITRTFGDAISQEIARRVRGRAPLPANHDTLKQYR
jgi:hypothetical protein